jgi:predicted dehydrogenase
MGSLTESRPNPSRPAKLEGTILKTIRFGIIGCGMMGREFASAAARWCHLLELDVRPEIVALWKPMNWKRTIELNGAYGCMGDLGLHSCFIPFRAGWFPRNVRAILSDVVKERPDGNGNRVPCRTWDNATLFCEATEPVSGEGFPLTFKLQRIAPGEKNSWYIEILGTKTSARFSTRQPRRLDLLEYSGGEQIWGDVQTGHETPFKTITGSIFEFGAPDSLLQMWAAFLYELTHGRPLNRFAACLTPAETALSHRLFTASLASHAQQAVLPV